jgi:predicted phage terminase large subunit-like protein
MSKSLTTSVFWPAWEWGPAGQPGLRYLSTSFSGRNVIRDSFKMRKLIESEKYQALYGETVRLRRDSKARDRFENTETGGREGRAFDNMTGGRGDRVIIDDPHSVDSAESDVQRATTVQTFREAIPDRLNDLTKSAIIVIMQRLHENDVAGTILQLGLPYVHLNMPMEYEAYREEGGRRVDARCRTFIRGYLFYEDPRQIDGELLFPERFPKPALEKLKTTKGSYAWAGQYQQRPTAREGGLFKRHWFSGKIITRDALPSGIFKRVRAWDFAATEEAPGKSPDWTAGVRMARAGPDYYVEGVERFQGSPGTVRRTVKGVAEVDPLGTTIRIPIDPGQAGVDQADSYVTALSGFNIKPIKPTGSKVTRAEPFSVQCEFGHVYLINSGPIEEGVDAWIEPFLDEICAFPGGRNDDQVDAAADAFNELASDKSPRIDSGATGTRATVAQLERDARYRYGNDSGYQGEGYGSVPSPLKQGIF